MKKKGKKKEKKKKINGQEKRNEDDTNAKFLPPLFSYFIRVFLTPLHKGKGKV